MITFAKGTALVFLLIGTFLLMQIILPIVSFKIWEMGQDFESISLTSPTSDATKAVLGVSIENREDFSYFISNLERRVKPNYSKFNLTIPRLNLEGIEVFLDSNDLEKGLAHLPGSTLPGERGNVFVSGHSAGSPLFSFKKIYFSKLQDLKKGDEIVVEASGSKFTYEVVGIKVIDPKDLSVINAPDEQGRYISLMTCVPPGLNFKRLVILGKMI